MAQFSGFTYAQIKEHIVKYIGNDSSEFADYVDDLIIMAEHRYFKMHDWSFTYRTNLALAVNPNSNQYFLNDGTIGAFMAAGDVETIRSDDDNVYLVKLELPQLRRLQIYNNDSAANVPPIYWAVAGDNKIQFWPDSPKASVLRIDGKITPPLDLTGAPQIPMRYQEAFIEYIKALALDRENDDRASNKKIEALGLIRQDIQDDMRSLGDTENPRIKSHFERPRASLSSGGEGGSTTMLLNARHNLTGSVSVNVTDYYLGCNTNTAEVTLQLPKAADAQSGKKYIIKDETGNASIHNVVVLPNGSETIDGGSTYRLKVNFEAISLICDGSNWYIA